MKTAMKRLLSFVLVAMMLVSVVPFQASADEGGTETETVSVRYILNENGDGTIEKETTSPAVEIPESLTRSFVKSKLDFNEANYGSYEIYYKDGTVSDWTVMPDSINLTGDTEVAINAYKYKVDVSVKIGDAAATPAGTISDVACVTYDAIVNKARETVQDVEGSASYAVTGVTFNDAALTGGEVRVTANSTAVVTFSSTTEKWVTFRDRDGNILQRVATKGGKLVEGSYPVKGPAVEGKVFKGWYSGGSNGAGNLLNVDAPADEYYAHYSSQSNGQTDGVSAITIYAKVYAEGKVVDEFKVLEREVVADHTNVLDHLKSKKDQILASMEAKGYGDAEWSDFRFYDNATKEPLTQADEVLKANKYVYIKLDLESTARVMVCVHGKVGTAGTYYKLDGYLQNGNYTSTYIQKSDVVTFLKTKYNVSSSNVDGLYGEQEWKELVNGERKTGTGVTSYQVKDNDDTTIVHVILNDATLKGSSSSSNKSDNPKTGDTILMAVTVMGLSASALAAVYFVSKKKQSL